MLCLGFRVRVTLVTHWWFSCWWAMLTLGQGCSCFSCCPTRKVTLGHEIGGDMAGQEGRTIKVNWFICLCHTSLKLFIYAEAAGFISAEKAGRTWCFRVFSSLQSDQSGEALVCQHVISSLCSEPSFQIHWNELHAVCRSCVQVQVSPFFCRISYFSFSSFYITFLMVSVCILR